MPAASPWSWLTAWSHLKTITNDANIGHMVIEVNHKVWDIQTQFKTFFKTKNNLPPNTDLPQAVEDPEEAITTEEVAAPWNLFPSQPQQPHPAHPPEVQASVSRCQRHSMPDLTGPQGDGGV